MKPGRNTLKLLRLKRRLLKRLDKLKGCEAGIDMDSMTDFYRKVWAGSAKEIRADFEELSRGVWKVSRDGRSTYINNYIVQIDDPVLLNIAGNKSLCYTLLKNKGLPVPEFETYTLDTLDRAGRFMEERGGGYFVVKPEFGTSGGRGITTHLASFNETIHASVLASLYSNEIIIERLAAGESYRLLVLNGEMIHASRRRGLRVKGDGRSTIYALAGESLDMGHPDKGRSKSFFETDRDTIATLGAQGLSAESVPSPGEEILVRSLNTSTDKHVEVRTVYNEDASGMISDELKEEAVKAAGTIGSRFSGIDIVTPDPALPLEKAGGVIVEVNTTPGLHHHYNIDTNGTGAGAAEKVLEYLLTGPGR